MVEPSVLEQRLRENLSGVTHVEVKDMTGTKDHFEAVIVASAFAGQSRVKQHQLVYGALGELMDGPVHALTFKTFTPDVWSAQQGAGRAEMSALSPELRERLDGLVHQAPVVLFMKGTKNFPQCGFSATVVEVLKRAGVADFATVNILADAEVRQGMKDYSNWPTFPQLFVRGELVGGCDIVRDLYESGELASILAGGERA